MKIRKTNSRKLRIAFINIYQGKVNRGGEVFVAELAKRLGEMHEVDVVAGERALPERWPILWRVFLDPQGLAIMLWTMRILPKIWRGKYDVVVPLNSGWQAGLVRVVTWLGGGKMVVVGQSGMGWDERINLLTFPDSFVAVSSEAKKWAKRTNIFLKNTSYIPNGVDLERFGSQGKVYNTELTWPVVVCVGALVDQKRIDLVIRAVVLLENVSLLVVGEGSQKSEIKKMGADYLGSRFELASVPHNKMPEVYRAGDVFCLVPEGSEAFGIVFVEAMASGMPVVTIADDQRKEIMGGAGVFVKKPEDPKKLARVIQKTLKKKWGDIPRRQASGFGWERVVGEYERLFLKIIK